MGIQPLLAYLLGYAAIMAVPGPNMLAIASVAALRGLGCALALCLGLALGAGTLAAVLLSLVLGQAAGSAVVLEFWGRVVGALCQGAVALLILRMRPLTGEAPPSAGGFVAGFCTAATNPLTAAYFISQFLGPLGASGAAAELVVMVTVGLAFIVFSGVAAVLSRPGARRLAVRWNRPVRLVAAAALGMTAMAMLVSAARL